MQANDTEPCRENHQLTSAFMVATFFAIFGAWKLLGIAPASLVIFGFQLGFSGSIYMIVMSLIRCFTKNMNVETYHFAYLIIGVVVAYFTYHQLLQVQEFHLEILTLLLLGIPVSLCLALREQKEE